MSEKPRILVSFEPLPERATAQERIAHAGTDVREAMAKLDRRLRDQASHLSVDGYVVDEAFAADTDDRFAVAGRVVVGRLRITRGGA